MADLDKLIADLESASEGSEALDERVALEVGWRKARMRDGEYRWQQPNGLGRGLPLAPRLTRSVDAALQLVPETHAVCHITQDSDGDWFCLLIRKTEWNQPGVDAKGAGSTPALAISAAALRAKRGEG